MRGRRLLLHPRAAHHLWLGLDGRCDAFHTSASSISEKLGAIMAPAVKNDAKNLETLVKQWKKFKRPASLRALLSAELSAGTHRASSSGHVLREPSAALSVVWLRRAFAFQASRRLDEPRSASLRTLPWPPHSPSLGRPITLPRCLRPPQTAILEGLLEDSGTPMSAVTGVAYSKELEKVCRLSSAPLAAHPPLSSVPRPSRSQHHNWMLKSTMKVALGAVPSREEFLEKILGSHVQSFAGAAEGMHQLYEDIGELVVVQRRVLRAMAKPLLDLDLERGI